MNKSWLSRILAFVCFAVGLLTFLLIIMMRTDRYGQRDPRWLLLPALFWLTIGLGLLMRKGWASAAFGGTFGLLAITLIVGSIVTVPMPWTLINILLGLLLAAIASLAVLTWRESKLLRHSIGNDHS